MPSLTAELGMEAIVEVHTPEELLRVLDTDAAILGINNRDLRTFSVDLSVTERLLDLLRAREPRTKRLVVAESGVRSPEDARFLHRCGADAVLVGEALVRAAEPERLLREFAEVGTP
jgi:indole-3-glycerol phosphate synthase